MKKNLQNFESLQIVRPEEVKGGGDIIIIDEQMD